MSAHYFPLPHRNTPSLVLILLLSVIDLSCAPYKISSPHPKPLLSNERGGPNTLIRREGPQFEQAKRFDLWMRGQLSAAQKTSLEKRCNQNPKQNIFCYSIRKRRPIKKTITRLSGESKRFIPKPIRPVYVRFEKGKITNWNQLRRARVKSLIRGLLNVPQEPLLKLATRALGEKRCPNNISVAVAATLEDFLPNGIVYSKIGSLYEKGGKCTNPKSRDKEHYLTRAALLHYLSKNYKTAKRILSTVKSLDFYSARAPYWLYRTQKVLGQMHQSRKTYRRILRQHPFSFHAAVLRTENETAFADQFASQTKFQSRSTRFKSLNLLIHQAEILHGYEFAESAAIIVNLALHQYPRMNTRVRLHLSTLTDPRGQVSIVSSLLLRRPKLASLATFKLLFPTYPYFRAMAVHKESVDPYLLLSIARKESTFNPKAISPANAKGLLQIHPNTAREMTGKEDTDLMNVETNVALAAKYVGHLLKKMNGDLPLVLAAYNAGEKAAADWVERFPTPDKLLFIDLVPYRETRDYIGFVMNNYHWYRTLYGRGPSEVLSHLVLDRQPDESTISPPIE